MSQRLIMVWLLILTVTAGYSFVFASRLDNIVERQAALNIRLEALEERVNINASAEPMKDEGMMDDGGAMMDDSMTH